MQTERSHEEATFVTERCATQKNDHRKGIPKKFQEQVEQYDGNIREITGKLNKAVIRSKCQNVETLQEDLERIDVEMVRRLSDGGVPGNGTFFDLEQ